MNSRIVVLLWLRFRTVSCSESSLCCSAEALLITSAASVWISTNMLLACRDRSDSWRRMLIKVWQFTASREINTSPLTSGRPLFILPRLRGSTILLWNGIFHGKDPVVCYIRIIPLALYKCQLFLSSQVL